MDKRTTMKSAPTFGTPDDENPEWTADDFRRARRVADVMPDVIEAAKRARGRPKVARPKAHVSLRLDPEVLAAFKKGGRGWQRRINEILARAILRESGKTKMATKARKPR